MNYLEKLAKLLGENVPELELLKCLEFIELDDLNAANAAKDAYVELTKKHRMLAHPLFLLAVARMTNESKYLKQFAELYAEAVDSWLKKSELAKLKGKDEKSKASSAAQNPVARWNALKEKDGVRSEGMEKLLKLIGLRKVKNATIDLFITAMKISKMDPETRKANAISCNYCFLGNAVSAAYLCQSYYVKRK